MDGQQCYFDPSYTAKSNCHALNCRVYGDAHYMEIWC